MKPLTVFACLVGLVALGATGCRSHQLGKDQDQMRQTLLTLYTNQIMDNLVRTKTGMPIVQLDYTNMTGTIDQMADGSLGEDQEFDNLRSLTTAPLRNFKNTLKLSLSSNEKISLTITSNPVLNNNEVYNAYLEFIGKPERFQVACAPPCPGEAHIVRCVKNPCGGGKLYYWVPTEYASDFFRLSLVTTVQRGQPLSPAPEYFETTVTAAAADEKAKDYALITLKTPIPNDNGTLTVTLEGEKYVLGFFKYPRPLAGEDSAKPDAAPAAAGEDAQKPAGPGFGVKVPYILVKISTMPGKDGKGEQVVRHDAADDKDRLLGKLTRAAFIQQLVGETVRINLNYYKPAIPTTDALIGAIQHDVNLIRLQQR